MQATARHLGRQVEADFLLVRLHLHLVVFALRVWSQNTPPREAISIGFGDMVSHAHFGYGRVVSMDRNIATIAFDAGKGIKKTQYKNNTATKTRLIVLFYSRDITINIKNL